MGQKFDLNHYLFQDICLFFFFFFFLVFANLINKVNFYKLIPYPMDNAKPVDTDRPLKRQKNKTTAAVLYLPPSIKGEEIPFTR